MSTSESVVTSPDDNPPPVWAKPIRDALNPALARPARLDGVEVNQIVDRGQPAWVLTAPAANPRDPRRYLKLEAEDLFVWHELDGERTVVELAKAFTRHFGTMGLFRVQQAVELFTNAGFLHGAGRESMYPAMTRQIARRTLAGRLTAFNRAALYRQITVPGFARSIRATYRFGGRLLTSRVGVVLLGATVGWGLWQWRTLDHPRPSELSQGQAAWVGLATLLSLYLHELAHGWATLRLGRRVERAGLLVVFGTPGAFVDTSDMWLASRRHRAIVTCAGVVANLTFAAGAIWMARRTGSTTWAATASAQYVLVVANATPLIKLDGYYLLMDAVDVPNLRERSLAYVSGGFFRAWRRAWSVGDLVPRLGRDERLLAGFGLAMFGWVIVVGLAGLLVMPERVWRTLQLAWGIRNGAWPARVFGFTVLVLVLFGVLQLVAGRRQVLDLARTLGRRIERSSGTASLVLVASIVLVGGVAIPNLAGTRSTAAEHLWSSLVPLIACTLAAVRGRAAATGAGSSTWRVVFAVAAAGCTVLAAGEALDLIGRDRTANTLGSIVAIAVLLTLAPAWRRILGSLRGDLRAAWVPVLFGTVLLLLPGVSRHVGALSMASGTVVGARLLRRPFVRRDRPADIPAGTVPNGRQLAAHLQRGFTFLAERPPKQIGELFGEPARRQFLTAANTAAVDAGWTMWFVEDGRLIDNSPPDLSQRSDIYAKALCRFVELIGVDSDIEVGIQAVAEARFMMPPRLGVLIDESIGHALASVGRPDLTTDPADPAAPTRFALRHLVNVPIDAAAATVGHLAIEKVVGATNAIASRSGWGLWCRANGQLHDDSPGELGGAVIHGRDLLAVLYANLAGAAGHAHVHRSVQEALDTIAVDLRGAAAALVDGLPWASVTIERVSVRARMRPGQFFRIMTSPEVSTATP